MRNASTKRLPKKPLKTDPAIHEQRRRREERRLKQRLTNVDRAQAMHLARIEQQKSLFAVSKPLKTTKATQYHIGCSGWFYWHWRNIFYPHTLPTNQWFNYYASQFETVELNAPFYSWPTVAVVKGWLRQIGRKQFLYTVKVSELITHVKRFKGTKELVKDFGFIADLLGDRMGCFLFQLPPSYHYTPARLRSIVQQLEPHQRNVVEFRHRSWWCEEVYKAFRKHKIIFCSCSGPRLPDELIKTADDIYVRFHGTSRWYRHDYTDEELKGWAERIRQSRATHAWIYFNNDREGHAISNAQQLAAMLGKS